MRELIHYLVMRKAGVLGEAAARRGDADREAEEEGMVFRRVVESVSGLGR